MAKLFVIQDRYNEEITNWYVFSNAAKAQSKFDELDDEREEDWQLESLNVSGPNCGFCIGFDDDMGEVFAEPVKDVSKYDGIGGFGRKNSTAYLFGPKSKEGKVMVGSYGELEYTGNLDVVAEWEESELMESKSTEKSLKHVKLFEQFINESDLKIKVKGQTIKVDTSSIEIEGIDTRDYPDFSDAFITYAEDHRGKELSDEEIEFLNTEHYDIIGEIIFDRQLYMR